MASAQLSSPHRAGAGSDLRETAPRRPWSLAQGAGPWRRLAAYPWHHPKLGRVVQPSSARTQAHPGLPAGRAVPVARPPRTPRPSARAHYPPREGGCSARARSELPRRTSPVPGPTQLRGARSGEREPGWFRPPSHPETSAKLGCQGARPGAEPELAQRPRHSVDAPSCSQQSPGSLPTALPAFQRVIKCISGVEKPRPGVPGSLAPRGIRDAGHGHARRPQRAGGFRLRLRGQATRSAGKGCEPMRLRPAVRVLAASAELQARPAPTSSAPGVTLKPRGLTASGRAPAWGQGRRHAQAEAGERTRNLWLH